MTDMRQMMIMMRQIFITWQDDDTDEDTDDDTGDVRMRIRMKILMKILMMILIDNVAEG